jgi:hypothetical protein
MTGPIGYDDLRHDTVIQVAKLMAGAAITAPKSGGQLFLAGKHNFIESVIVDDTVARDIRLTALPSARLHRSGRQSSFTAAGHRNLWRPDPQRPRNSAPNRRSAPSNMACTRRVSS